MRDLTLVMAHYMNLGILAEQQKVWMAYSAKLRAKLHVIVVDDCSPKGNGRPYPSHLTATGLASFRLYRLLKKVRWNWLAARNLGMNQATTEWVLMTDIDHVMPAETLKWILTAPLDTQHVYRFSRVDAPHPWPYTLQDCTPYKYHPDTWLLTRAMFDSVGGYDERLSGCYGTSGEFRDRVLNTAKAHVRIEEVMVRYPREIIADASTTVYTRKGDPANDIELVQRRQLRSLIPDWKPLRGTFPWEQVAAVPAHEEVLCN